MNYGLYLSANGVLSNLYRQDVAANNLANVETVGFKPDMVLSRQRPPQRLEGPGVLSDPQLMLEQLGGGHFVDRTRTVLDQGSLERTGNPLDVAIDGEGLFVLAPDRAAGPADMRFTRDGRFTRDATGHLVTTVNGMRVLGEDGQPIRLANSGPVSIAADGAVSQDGAVVGRMRVVSLDAERLLKTGGNLFRLSDDALAASSAGADAIPGAAPARGAVRQGFVETAAVNPIMTLNTLIAATKAAQANTKLMQYHDFLSGQAISTFGRVS